MRELKVIQPSSSLAGRQFAPVQERELHEFVADVTTSLPGPAGPAWIVPEMPSPLGLPDFVALLGGEAWLTARLSVAAPPVLAEAECVALSVLHTYRPLSRNAIARRLSWDVSRLNPIADRLVRAGVAIETIGGALTVAEGMTPMGQLIAIEAKVKDWRRAVRQGRTYRTWSDNYVIVLGNVGPAARDRALGAVNADGGGLFVDGDWLTRPVRRQATRARRLLGYEHLFAALHSHPPF